jgi:hypothetical protein
VKTKNSNQPLHHGPLRPNVQSSSRVEVSAPLDVPRARASPFNLFQPSLGSFGIFQAISGSGNKKIFLMPPPPTGSSRGSNPVCPLSGFVRAGTGWYGLVRAGAASARKRIFARPDATATGGITPSSLHVAVISLLFVAFCKKIRGVRYAPVGCASARATVFAPRGILFLSVLSVCSCLNFQCPCTDWLL